MNTILIIINLVGVAFIIYSFGKLIKYLKDILKHQFKIEESLLYVHIKLNYLTFNTPSLNQNTEELENISSKLEDKIIKLKDIPPSVLFKDNYENYKNQLLDLTEKELNEIKETFIKNQWYEELKEIDKAIKYVRTNKKTNI